MPAAPSPRGRGFLKLGGRKRHHRGKGFRYIQNKKGAQFEGNWNSLSHTAISTKPVSRLGMLLCLEEQGGFFACVYELGFLLLLSYPTYLLFFCLGKEDVRVSDPVQKRGVLEE